MPVALLVALLAAADPAPAAPPAATAPPAAAAPQAAPAAGPAKPEVHVIDEKERVDLAQTDVVRLSLPTESDVEAWAEPGLRVQLGYGYGPVSGFGPAWSFRSHAALLRPSVRLDARWELGLALAYGTGPNGLRWSVTAEPTFFAWRQLALGVGLGYGGLSVADQNRSQGRLQGPSETVSRYLTSGEYLQQCAGSALSTLLRAQYLFVVGPLFATGPFAQAGLQWTRCEETFGRSDPETGQPVVLIQWWQQSVASFGWAFSWR